MLNARISNAYLGPQAVAAVEFSTMSLISRMFYPCSKLPVKQKDLQSYFFQNFIVNLTLSNSAVGIQNEFTV